MLSFARFGERRQVAIGASPACLGKWAAVDKAIHVFAWKGGLPACEFGPAEVGVRGMRLLLSVVDSMGLSSETNQRAQI